MGEARLNDEIAALLARARLSSAGLRITACAPGGNNRIYRVLAGGRSMVAKHYFRHPSDTRDRLSSEYTFLEYARLAGIDCVPAPVARDDSTGLGIYEFIDGRKLQPEELQVAHVEQAQDFLLRLNGGGARTLGARLPEASEACFSIAAQLDLVQGRIERLADIRADSSVDEQAIAFAADLRLRWNALREHVLAQSARMDLRAQLPLAAEDRCISPSDFGFHNALAQANGKLVFIDFEYAGWDDPAKAVGDFFSQPEVPVPIDHFERFLASTLCYSASAARLAQRTRLLFPVFRIKWCCIVMNHFLPLYERRRFADPAVDAAPRKQVQLDKARRLLGTVN
jgi:hypothetical protein